MKRRPKNNKMSFQSKLVMTYSIFTAILMSCLGSGFYYYNAFIFEKNSHAGLMDTARKMSLQLDYCVHPMDFLAMDIISRSDVVRALSNLANISRDDQNNNKFIKESIQVIRNNIIRDSVNRTVYRLSIFNMKGDFFTSNYSVETNNRSLDERLQKLNWIGKVRALQGHKYLVPPRLDFWADQNPVRVFSLVRMIRNPGYEVGFIEVQTPADVFAKICATQERIRVLVVDDQSQVFYTNRPIEKKALRYYFSLSRRQKNGTFAAHNPFSQVMEVVGKFRSAYTGWTVLLIQDQKTLLAPLAFTRNVTLLIGSILMLVTFIFFYIFSLQLTKPLKKLTKAMEDTSIATLPDQLTIHNETNEIESLAKSFQKMRERLNEAINHEIKSRSLQLTAHFDALQSQINPHFMYNILNVVANMGLEAGVAEISETCRRIAAMLRYSTAADNHRTTIRNEIGHVENYLILMKKRFEHKLEYEIQVDERMQEISIPKLILQPLVENSLYHGFEKSAAKMVIKIQGRVREGEWQIELSDNGSGFEPEVLEDLERKIEGYASEVCNWEGSKGLAIGGMGIISTFARLRLFYGDELRFVMKNQATGGALIRIGGHLEINEVRGGEAVPNHDC